MAVATLPFAVAASDRSADAVLVQALRAALVARAHRLLDGALHHHSDIEDTER